MKKLKMIFLLSLTLLITPLVYSADVPDNSSTQQTQKAPDNQSSTTNITNSSGGGSADLNDLANQFSQTNDSFVDVMDSMFAAQSQADNGEVLAKVSTVMSKPYAILSQFIRGCFVFIILIFSVPDLIALLLPSSVPFWENIELFRRGQNSGGMGSSGSSDSQGKGLLSPDYYKAVGSGSSGGGMGSGQGDSKSNPFMAYVKTRMMTLVFAAIAVIVLMTPLGLFIVKFIISLILTAGSKIFSGLASMF